MTLRGAKSVRLSGHWSDRWKLVWSRSRWCFGSIRCPTSWTPKNKACNFVGGVVSPILANLYLHEQDRFMAQYTELEGTQRHKRKQQGFANFLYARYADDVRHITWRQIPFAERRGSEDTTPGSTTYLDEKA